MTTLSSPAALWERTLKALRQHIDAESFSTWIEPLRVGDYADGELRLIVPSIYFRNWVASNYLDEIEQAFGHQAGREVYLTFEVESGEGEDAALVSAEEVNGLFPTPERPVAGRLQPMGPALPSTRLNPSYTFESFVVGESNRFAYAAAQAVADPESRAYNPLFLYGGAGLGKTHLMHAIGQQMLAIGPRRNVLYVSSEVFMNAFIEAIRRKEPTQFRNCFRSVDLLLIDDVQFFAGAERSQIEFFHTFNALFDAGKKIVISSDHPPKELTELEERLRSRFEAGLIVDIQPPDLETRVAILQRKAQDLGLALNAETAIYMAERIRTNIRKLEGALKKLSAHCSVRGDTPSIETARKLLVEFFSGEEPLKISVEKIQLVVCKFFDINIHDLIGGNRSRKFTVPRQYAAFLAREMTEMSYPEIARKFGGRDHTSIIHAHRKVKRELEGDLNKQNLVKYLTKLVKEEPFPETRR